MISSFCNLLARGKAEAKHVFGEVSRCPHHAGQIVAPKSRRYNGLKLQPLSQRQVFQNWTTPKNFFSPPLVIVFLQEVEKDVKDKAGVKIRFLIGHESPPANRGYYICELDQGGDLALVVKTPFSSGETIFLNTSLK